MHCRVFLPLMLGVAVSGCGESGSASGERIERGRLLFTALGCRPCHQAPGNALNLAGIYDREVELRDGSRAIRDDEYLRRALTRPQEELVAGRETSMPAYDSLDEGDLEALVEFLKSLE